MTHPSESIEPTPNTGEREAPRAGLSAVEETEAGENQFANLTIRVQKRQRLHWLIEAKKQGTSLTAAITDALNERFGTPE